jgi:hypothetical protein
MPAAKKYPVHLDMGISKEMQADLNIVAAKRNVPVAELVRNLLAASLTDDAANAALVAVRQAVRTEIRQELKRVENRLASLGSKANIAAGTAEFLLQDVLENARSSGTSPEERKRVASMLHDEARKKAINLLKQPIPEDGSN